MTEYVTDTIARFARFESEASWIPGQFRIRFPADDTFALDLAKETARDVTESRNANGFVFGYVATFARAIDARNFKAECLA
jgi:hypothetical protein